MPAMITLFGETAAPNRAGGMALNGFVLFLGASVGPLTAYLGLDFPILLVSLAALMVLAVATFRRHGRVPLPRSPLRVRLSATNPQPKPGRGAARPKR